MKIGSDKVIRKSVDKTHASWVIHKATYRSKLATESERQIAHEARIKLSKQSGSPNIVVNTCVLTGETRSILSKFGRNRHLVRDIARRGKLPGIIKASW